MNVYREQNRELFQAISDFKNGGRTEVTNANEGTYYSSADEQYPRSNEADTNDLRFRDSHQSAGIFHDLFHVLFYKY